MEKGIGIKLKPVVDFMIIGAQKCGTTTLFNILKQHPDLCACKLKEPGFFLDRPYKEEILNVNQYHSLFEKEPNQLAFEATVGYTNRPFLVDNAWNPIFEYNSNMKFIYMVRNPVDRIISAHRFLYRLGYIGKSHKNINVNLSHSDYHIDISKYNFQIGPFINKFGKENVFIGFFSELKSNPERLTIDILRFLKVDDNTQNIDCRLKKNSKDQVKIPRWLSPKFALYLMKITKLHLPNTYNYIKKRVKRLSKVGKSEDYLEINETSLNKLSNELIPEIISLEKITGRDLSEWKKNLMVNNSLNKKLGL